MNKFGAKKVIIDGIKFDSIKEGRYYQLLVALKKAKNEADRVIKIELQPKFRYEIEYKANGNVYKKRAFYKADFKVIYADCRIEIIDVKGYKTDIYKQKKKIIEALYNIEIIEK